MNSRTLEYRKHDNYMLTCVDNEEASTIKALLDGHQCFDGVNRRDNLLFFGMALNGIPFLQELAPHEYLDPEDYPQRERVLGIAVTLREIADSIEKRLDETTDDYDADFLDRVQDDVKWCESMVDDEIDIILTKNVNLGLAVNEDVVEESTNGGAE